ncbi:MAG: PAS domain S-box protein [Candidatus Lernaella stagnicola]|nr:PAS domain S-box protein [Candidatus Lernaella stagnicola]
MTTDNNPATEIARLRQRVAELESQIAAQATAPWSELIGRQLLVSVFEHFPWPVQLYSADGHHIMSNKATEAFFGRLPPQDYNFFEDEAINALGITNVIRDLIARRESFVDLGEYPYNIAEANPHLEGAPDHDLWLRTMLFVDYDAAGQTRHFVVIHLDVSESVRQETGRRRVENKLLRQEELTRNFIERNPYSIVVHDRKGRFLFANAKFYDLFFNGRRPEPPANWTMFDDPTLQDPALASQLKKIFGGEIAHMETEISFNPAKLTDLQELAVDVPDETRFLHVTIFGVSSREGSVTTVVAMHEDITDRKKIEKRIASKHKFLDAIIELNPYGIAVMDRDGHIQSVNEAFVKLFGFSPGPDFDWRLFEDPIAEKVGLAPKLLALREGKTVRISDGFFYNPRLVYPGESQEIPDVPLWLRVVAFPIMDEAGELANIVVMYEDITEQQNLAAQQESMRAQIQEMQKLEALSTMASGIAHDFNTVLSVIKGFAEVSEELAESPRLLRCQQQILAATKRAGDLVDKMMIFSRRVVSERRPLPLQKTVAEAMELLTGYFPATIRVKRDMQLEDGFVIADTTEIHQVLFNLCINAYEAMADTGGRLTVSLRPCDLSDPLPAELPDGRYCRLSVRDTGAGMDEETKQRVFEPFFSTKAIGQGCGMGLAVVHGIVQACGGHVVVGSELGKGTSFHVYLPLIEACEIVEADHGEEAPRGTGHILLVDDEPSVVESMSMNLERLGYSVTSCLKGNEAARRLEAEPEAFDLLITDQVMSDLSGIELSRIVHRHSPQLPILIVSAFEKPEVLAAIEASPNVGFLHKPFATVTIAKTIRDILTAAKENLNAGHPHH